MDATKLRQTFEKLDQALEHPTELLIRGGAAAASVSPSGHPPAADLVVGKLKRLEPEDITDVAFLIERFRLTEADLMEAFERLPARFKTDPVVQDNFRFVVEDYL